MKKLFLAVGFLAVGAFTANFIKSNPNIMGISNPKGVPLYVIIEVNWDGTGNGDWKVWGPKYEPIVGAGGTVLAECTDCLEMNYDFEFKGKTVHFKETYVSTVDGRPQTHNVILTDKDGDGTYTGSLPAARYNLQEGYIYLDRIDYEVTFEAGVPTSMRYLEYEHKKLVDN